MVYSKRSGKPRGYAFIEYEHERDMHCEYLRLRPPSGPLSSLLPRPLPAVWPTPTPPNLTSAVSLLLLPLFLIYLLFLYTCFFKKPKTKIPHNVCVCVCEPGEVSVTR